MTHRPAPHLLHSLTRSAALAIACLSCSVAFAADPPAMTETQKTLYAIGLSMARSAAVFDLTAEEFEYVKMGLTDAQTGKKLLVEQSAYNAKIQDLAKARRKAQGKKQAGAGKAFIEKAAKEKGAITTKSGIVYIATAEGHGAFPKPTDIVKVNYRGTLVDGKEFDSSFRRGTPLEFKLDNVIKCWTEALQLMKPGGKARLVCPSQLAYGDNGAGDLILPGATLAFDVDLLEVRQSALPQKPAAAQKPTAPTAPQKPAAAPPKK